MTKTPINFDINALAIQRGEEFGIPRRENEYPDNYRLRAAGELRRRGNYLEAHEANSGRLYDDPEQGLAGPMAGIFGVVAQAMQGREYSPHDSERQIGDDIITGVVVRAGRDEGERALATIFGALGPKLGMDFIEATRKDRK
ncbi:MAG: hypothetical protein AABX11_03720 [Nanoarchaeota archaeon]